MVDSFLLFMANSGTMAIKYLSINKPDLVLLDYEMPVINGKQVLEMIRSEEDFGGVSFKNNATRTDKSRNQCIF